MKVELFETGYPEEWEQDSYWEADVYIELGKSIRYGEYKTAGEAIDHLLSVYPAIELEVDITTLEAYNLLQERENTNV